MPQRLSTILQISEKDFERMDVFNAFADIDSKLYVDPSLLKGIKINEFKDSYKRFLSYFNNILKLIDQSKKKGDIFWRQALSRLVFKETKFVALGYSIGNNNGNAIGKKLALKLLETSSEIIRAGIKDPIIFELVGIMEEGIGADRISDMTIKIIKEDLIRFTNRVCNELGINQRVFNILDSKLPINPQNNKPIVFVPKGLLRDLPVAYSWTDIDYVCQANYELRNRVNKIIGNTWKSATKRITKNELKDVLLSNPELIKDLIAQYRKKIKAPYDFVNDPSGEVVWAELAEKAVQDYPLNLLGYVSITNENILGIVKIICDQFAKLIESNGWFEFLYDQNGKLRNERFAQKLFYGIADQYCLANDLNLSREPNAGSGALDFKISKGYRTLVTVEVKYSSNSNLIKGYTKQLPTYNKAENAEYSIYLILKTTNSDRTIQKLNGLNSNLLNKGQKLPEVIIIDARPQKSASLRK